MKFNIGNKVLPNDESNGMFKEDGILYSWYEVYKHEKGIVDTYPEGDTKYSWAFSDSELQLIEQDTKEDTPRTYPTAQDSGIVDPPRTLSYDEQKVLITDLKDTIEIQADIILQQALINAKGNND